MPTYQYSCKACGHELEAVQSFSDDPLTECPQCTGQLRKVFSAVGVVFKGSGFYRTDSRVGNGSNGSNGAKSNGKGPENSGSASKDSGGSNGSGGSSGSASGSGGSGGSGAKDSAKSSAATG